VSAATSIEWTDRTWNPVTGCSKVSPGCAHCYAEGVAKRFWATQYEPIDVVEYDPTICSNVNEKRPRQFTDVLTHADRLLEPLSWRKPARVFVNSMSDLFHEDVPFDFIAAVFGVMAAVPRHTYQILTKRPQRMRDWFEWLATQECDPWTECHWEALQRDDADERLHRQSSGATQGMWPLPNVWLGVSVENQHFADERIPLLLQTPAAVRFISAEPLLGPLALNAWLDGNPDCPVFDPDCLSNDGECHDACEPPPIDWVIVGGESGPNARPFDIASARSVVSQCKAAGVPVFVKQVGAVPMLERFGREDKGAAHVRAVDDASHPGGLVLKLKDRNGGDPTEWPEDIRVRDFPTVAV
jgi:protein gp37